MGKKFDITNCSPRKCVIQLGLRHIHPNQTAYSVDESEVGSGVKKLVSSGDLRMVDSIGKKAALKKTNLDRPILSSPPKEKSDPKIEAILKPRGINSADLKKFPWLSTFKKQKEVDSVMEIKAKDNGTVEISAVYKKRETTDEKLAKAKEVHEAKMEKIKEVHEDKIEAAMELKLPKTDTDVKVEEVIEDKPRPKRRRRRKKNVSDS